MEKTLENGRKYAIFQGRLKRSNASNQTGTWPSVFERY
jgi:hypothetical protein